MAAAPAWPPVVLMGRSLKADYAERGFFFMECKQAADWGVFVNEVRSSINAPTL
jgi:hypothetical protein